MSGWLSVDPMADKYPGISPYAYCAWNPVRLVDPTGMAIDASSMAIAQTMTEDVLKKGLSKVGNLIRGYGTLGLDAGWLAAGYAKTIFPKLKSQLPEGAKITKPNNRIGAGVGLIPH